MARNLFAVLLLVFSTILLISTTGCSSEEIVDKSATEKNITQTSQNTTLSENFDYSIKENKYLLINKIFNTEDINEFKKIIPLLNKLFFVISNSEI